MRYNKGKGTYVVHTDGSLRSEAEAYYRCGERLRRGRSWGT